jgi:uncharacterized short protein YbdD (DUF466 family)
MSVNTTPFPAVVRSDFAEFLQATLSGEPIAFKTGVTASEDVVLCAEFLGDELRILVGVRDFEFYAPQLSEPGDSLETSGEYFQEIGAELESAVCAYFSEFPLRARYITTYDEVTHEAAFFISASLGDSDETTT